MPKHILVEVADRVGRITFNMPQNLNALTPEMLEEVLDAVEAFEVNPDVRVLMFTGP